MSVPIIYNGDAIHVRLPDQVDNNGHKHQVWVITFPHFIHQILLGNNKNETEEVLGIDLEKGMVLIVNNQLAFVVDVNKGIPYYGTMFQPLDIGILSDDIIKRKKFVRRVYTDRHFEWIKEKEWDDDKYQKCAQLPQLE